MDERFDPAKALAATGRYLKQAKDEFGREDLAVVSYHMGIGNLQSVLGAYGDDGASYAQLYFDASPDSHARAYRMLYGLGDDSKTYYWRVLASREVMRLYRDDRSKLERLAGAPGAARTRASWSFTPTGRRTTPSPGTLTPEATALLAYIRHGVSRGERGARAAPGRAASTASPSTSGATTRATPRRRRSSTCSTASRRST